MKALAAQTARAPGAIAAQIAAIRASTGEAVGAVHEVCAVIARIDEVATVIASAVEEQGATTRDIAASVQAMTIATHQTTDAMRDVTKVSEDAGKASQSVLAVAEELGQTAHVLGVEMKEFLRAMASPDKSERRRYERVSGRNTTAVLHVPGEKPQHLVINDIARGGVALRCDWWTRAGMAVGVGLPGLDNPLPARLVRSTGGLLSLAFLQEEEVMLRVDQAIDRINAAVLRDAA